MNKIYPRKCNNNNITTKINAIKLYHDIYPFDDLFIFADYFIALLLRYEFKNINGNNDIYEILDNILVAYK